LLRAFAASRRIKKRAPPKRGPNLAGLTVELIADHPAISIWATDSVLPSASARSYRSNNYARHNYGWGAPVAAAVVAVATASAVGSAMEANAASASDWNDQTVLSLIASNRHGLSGN
jgi:hypothetical protein